MLCASVLPIKLLLHFIFFFSANKSFCQACFYYVVQFWFHFFCNILSSLCYTIIINTWTVGMTVVRFSSSNSGAERRGYRAVVHHCIASRCLAPLVKTTDCRCPRVRRPPMQPQCALITLVTYTHTAWSGRTGL